jgi:hypothetical protein
MSTIIQLYHDFIWATSSQLPISVNHLRLKPKAWGSRVQVAGSHLPAPGTGNNIRLADSQHLVAVSLESLNPGPLEPFSHTLSNECFRLKARDFLPFPIWDIKLLSLRRLSLAAYILPFKPSPLRPFKPVPSGRLIPKRRILRKNKS